MFSDFTSNSTVHGVRYLGERRRHWSEKAFWVIVFLISITGCSFVIMNMFDKWQQNPIISTIKETAPFDIPQPAVTICPQVKVNRKYLDFNEVSSELLNKYHGKPYNNITSEENLKFEALTHICKGLSFFVNKSTLESDLIVPTLKDISFNRGEFLYFCQFKITWDWQECDEYFTEIMTGEGNCFTLNMLNSSEIFRDNV